MNILITLCKEAPMKAVLIINPCAGKKQLAGRADEIKSLLGSAGYETDVHFTRCEGDGVRLAAEYGARCGLLVCGGGDGTLSEVIKGLMPLKVRPKIGYIPAGTTNDFAKSLGISGGILKAAQNILTGTARSVDIGMLGEEYFLYVASFGAFTKSSYATPQNLKNTLGHFAYVLDGIKEIPSIKPCYLAAYGSDGKRHEGKYILGSVSNTTSIGGVIKFDSEKVEIDDGLFEVMLIPYPKNLAELNRAIISLKTHRYDGAVDFFHTSKLHLECDEAFPWSLDGEYFAGGQSLDAKIMPSAVSIILPNRQQPAKPVG